MFGLGRLGLRLLGGPDQRAAGVPGPVAAVLRRATAPRPADRYPDADAFRAALRRAIRRPGDPGPAGAPPPGTRSADNGPRPDRVGRAVHRDHADQADHAGRADRLVAGPSGFRRGAARRLRLVGAAALALVAVGVTAGDAGAPAPGPGRGRSGPVSVTLPAGWRAAGTGWAGRYDARGRLEPALVCLARPRPVGDRPDGARGLRRAPAAARRTTPADFVAQRPHADCVALPVRRTRPAGVEWVVAGFSCPAGRPVLVEAAARAGRDGLLYAQIVPPPGSGPDFVDTLLAGVRIRPTGG